MNKKENKSQFNIFNFIIILCFIVSTIFLFQVNNYYFKKVWLLLIFNIFIYALINAYTKSQKTLLNLTAFYTIYIFFITFGIFMLTYNISEEINHNNPTLDINNAETTTDERDNISDSDYSFSDYSDSDLDEINE